jgi:hypothetical protein
VGPRGEQVLLLLAGAGALVIFLDLGLGASLAGLGAIAVCTTATGLTRRAGSIRRWWPMLALGAALLVVAIPFSLLAETPGGVLTVAGGTLVVVAVALGFPERSGQGSLEI